MNDHSFVDNPQGTSRRRSVRVSTAIETGVTAQPPGGQRSLSQPSQRHAAVCCQRNQSDCAPADWSSRPVRGDPAAQRNLKII